MNNLFLFSPLKKTVIVLTSFTVLLFLVLPQGTVFAAGITVTPLTWNVIGLDSNDPSVGPNDFPVGARVCNTSGVAVTDVTATFVWTSSTNSTYIYERPGTSLSYTTYASPASLANGACTDFYFEVQVKRDSAAYNLTRQYRIDVTAQDAGSAATFSGSTPTPRELFVEHLISQSRNYDFDIKLAPGYTMPPGSGGTSIPAGGTMTLMVGQTYDITVNGKTATQGYNQLEEFINFPNTIFQVLKVYTQFSADDSPYVSNPSDKLYGDACQWENNPGSPNYRSCTGGDYRNGGSVDVTYTVKILQVPGAPLFNPQPLTTLVYDFSGSSYHYNSDYGISTRFAYIVGPSSVTMEKSFAPKVIAPNGTSVMTIRLTNPTPQSFTDVNFSDPFPGILRVAGTPGVTYSGCGSGVLSSTTPTVTPLAGNETTIYFLNGTLAANSTCTMTVNVTATANGTYDNKTGNLFINSSVDTGNFGEDILFASTAPSPPTSCGSPTALATWNFENGGTGTNPNYTGPLATDVTGASAQITGSNPAAAISNAQAFAGTYSWQGNGWPTAAYISVPAATSLSTYYDFSVDYVLNKYGGIYVSFKYYLTNGDWGNPGNNGLYLYARPDTGSFNAGTGVNPAPKGSWQPAASYQTYTPASTSVGATRTTFRISATGAQNTTAEMYLDNVTIYGCVNTVASPPTISKAFSLASIPQGATSSLQFTITNPNSTSALSDVAFTDVLPTGLSVANGSYAATCTPAAGSSITLTATAPKTLVVTAGSLAAGASCTVSVPVAGTAGGSYQNVSGNISAGGGVGTNTSSTGYATAPLKVIAPPSIAKQFGTTTLFNGNTTSLKFTITNPNLSDSLTGVQFSDPLPTGLVVAATPNVSYSGCGAGAFSPALTGGETTISFSGATVNASSTCTVTLDVRGASVGIKNNTSSAVSSTNGGAGNQASASLTVNDPISLIGLNKQISTDNINWYKYVGLIPPQNIWYKFTVFNDGETTLNDISVTDPGVTMCTLPVSSLAPGATTSCIVGPISIASAPMPDPKTNTATVTTTTYSPPTPVTSSAKYGTEHLAITKNVTESFFTKDGDLLHYSYTVTNDGGYPLAGPVTVTDDHIIGAIACQDPTAVGDFDGYLDPGETVTCPASGTVPYTVTASDVTARLVTNIAYGQADGVNSPSVSETVPLAALTIDKDTTTSTVAPTGTVTYTVALLNTSGATLTNLQATDTLPDFNGAAAGKGYTVTNVIATGGLTVNFPGFDGDTNTNLLAAGNSLAAGASQTITITLTLSGATAGSYDNTAAVSSAQTGPLDDDGTVVQDAGTPFGSDPETDEDVTVSSNGSLVIVKNALPDDAQDFAYTVSGTGLTPFTLDDDADAALPNTQTFNGLAAGGTYTVSETAVAGWSVTNISCTGATGSTVTIGAAGGFDAGDTAVSILLAAGETVTCTFENSAILSVVTTKTAGDTSIPASGQSVTYIVEVENTSLVEVILDSLADDSFGNLTTVHDNVTATTCATGSAIAPGATYTCAFAATVSGTFPGTHINTVTAQVSNGSNTASDADDETVTFEEASPELTVVKSSSAGGTVHPGDPITYSITITNTGNLTQNNIVVSDAQPAGTTYVNYSSLATGYSIEARTYLDQFGAAQFNNSNGSAAWGGTPWTETGDDGLANLGKIQINTSTTGMADFQATAPTDVLTLTRPVNLTNAASATLTYSIAENGTNSATDIAQVQVWNGTAWTTVATYSGDFTSAAGNVNILTYANAGTQIRFVVTGFDGGTQNLVLDNVQVQFTSAAAIAKDNDPLGGVSGSLINGSPPTLLFSGDSFDLLPGQSMTVSYQATVNNPVPVGQTQVVNIASVTSAEIVTPVQATVTDDIVTFMTLTLRKTWTNAILNDAVNVTAAVGGVTLDTLSSTANTANETDTDPTPVNVTAGQVITFGETFTVGSAANYTSSLACTGATDTDLSDGLTVNAADTAIVCTETNTRKTATLTLQKTWVNAATGDTATVDLSAANNDSLSSTADSASETDADATPTTVYAGETVTISEALGAGNTGSYIAVLSCSGAADMDLTDGLTIDPADTAIVCTETNTRLTATLTLLKTVVNNNGGTAAETDWTLTATGPTTISGTEGDAAITDVAVLTGTYTLSESGGPGGYTASAWSCAGAADANPGDGLAIASGEDVTCTIINDDDPPSLTLVKSVTNNNGGTAAASDWTLTANGTGANDVSGAGPSVSSGATLQADTFTLSESGPAGYTASAWMCTNGVTVTGGLITLDVGQSTTCTIVNNDDAPSLTLNKIVLNDNGGTAAESDWTLTATGPTTLSGAGAPGGADVVSGAGFEAGTYTLSESGPAGYTASAWTCTNGVSVDGASQITLGLGQTTVCSITNDDTDLLPQADPNTNTAVEGGPAVGGNVLTNETSLGNEPTTVTSAVDDDGDPLGMGVPFATDGGGSLTLNTDGTYSYTPPAWNLVPPTGLVEVFTYTITDMDGDPSTTTLTITVTNDNRVPVANDDTNSTTEDTPVSGDVTPNDTLSGDGGNTWNKLTDPGDGTVIFNADGTYTYTPDPGFYGMDSFTYEICDVDDDCDPATVTITIRGDPRGLNKTIVASNEASTTDPDVAIGEIVTYEVRVTVPPGTFANARLVDTMERGLSYMDCVGITPNGMTTDVPGGFASICASPAVDSAGGTTTVDVGRRVTFDFGTLTNGTASDQTLEVRYRTVVLDSAQNVSGVDLDNRAEFLWSSSSLGPASETLVVVEPEVSIVKIASATSVAVGDEITITLTIRHTAASETNAFDVVVTDDLPAELQYVAGSLECISGAQPANTCSQAGGIITAGWDNFTLAGGVGRVTFRVTVLSLPAAGIVNTANVAWTSLPGVPPAGPGLPPGQQNINVFSTERDYDPGDLIDVYGASSALTLGASGSGGGGTGGTGPRRSSSLADLLPATGFAPGKVTDLSHVPLQEYASADGVSIEIPALRIRLPVVGVPRKDGAWNVSWLGRQAGWLEGSAFPSWNGNSVLTGHVYLSNGLPGPFVNLSKLKFGDQIIIHAYGQKYTFEVRENVIVEPDDTSVLKHEEKPWLTLVTCKEYDEKTNTYRKRVAIRAVLVSVAWE